MTALILGLTVLTTVHAKSDRNKGVITLEVTKVDGECRVLIQSEKPISNVILNLGDDQEKIEYLYEEQDDGSVTSSPIGNTYDLGEYVVGSALEDDYESIHVKAGNNGKRGVGEKLDLDMVDVAEECAVKTYEIGKTGPGGGIVFYVDPDDATMGLEAAPVDQGSALWCDDNTDTGATDTAVNTGDSNTAAILDSANSGYCSIAGNAAEVATQYMGPDDATTGWFLPSRDELNEMYTAIGPGCTPQTTCNVGGFAFEFYWGSSEFDIDLAWYQDINFGGQFIASKLNTFGVRAVRAFNNLSL